MNLNRHEVYILLNVGDPDVRKVVNSWAWRWLDSRCSSDSELLSRDPFHSVLTKYNVERCRKLVEMRSDSWSPNIYDEWRAAGWSSNMLWPFGSNSGSPKSRNILHDDSNYQMRMDIMPHATTIRTSLPSQKQKKGKKANRHRIPIKTICKHEFVKMLCFCLHQISWWKVKKSNESGRTHNEICV